MSVCVILFCVEPEEPIRVRMPTQSSSVGKQYILKRFVPCRDLGRCVTANISREQLY